MSAPHLNGFSAGAGADADAADTTAVLALTQSRCARCDCLRDSDACDTLCTQDGLPMPRLMDGAAAGRDAMGHDATWRARACAATGATTPAVQVDIMFQISADSKRACIYHTTGVSDTVSNIVPLTLPSLMPRSALQRVPSYLSQPNLHKAR